MSISVETQNRTNDALGQSDAFVAFQQDLSRVAPVERPVLIIGERGTGKELAATRLHYLSSRWNEALVTLNCAALAPTLIASELFGHEAGAFTGASKPRTGRFETAHLGTLFLDEIGSIPFEAQEKILRVVEYGSFERVGSSSPTQVNVRIIGATHHDLPTLAESGKFKRDLLDRLSFEVLVLPALRERQEDILLLTNHFAARMAFELELASVPEFSSAAIARLQAHQWPGNIRELKNVIERAVYRSGGLKIDEIEFDPFRSARSQPISKTVDTDTQTKTDTSESQNSLPDAIRQLEIQMLKDALTRARFNQSKAAKILGLSYHQFRGLYRKHIKRPG
ncbi:MAG: phage shock protein operon transcriptional activator [Deltaproteobacteria bacterium]|nr:phage shock protein operon transcriptional activator [Deltaproteobacteria bacterium]